jgi:hypothetical protein
MSASRSARSVRPLAVLAGLLWAAQGLIWTLGPKVQAAEAPFAVLDHLLFALFWIAIVGAIASSAAVLPGLLRSGGCTGGRLGRVGTLAARATLVASSAAGVAVVVAALGVAEQAGLAVLSPALTIAGLLLLLALSIAGVAIPRAGVFHGVLAVLPAVLSVLMLLTLGVILASGSTATVGLILAVVIVAVHGTTWLLLGWAFGQPGTTLRAASGGGAVTVRH